MRSNRNAASVPQRNSTESSAQLGGTLARVIPAFKLFPQRLGARAMTTDANRRITGQNSFQSISRMPDLPRVRGGLYYFSAGFLMPSGHLVEHDCSQQRNRLEGKSGAVLKSTTAI